MRTDIRDWQGIKIGSIDTDNVGNVKAYDFYGRYLG